MTRESLAFVTVSVGLVLMSSPVEARGLALTPPAPTQFFSLSPCRAIDTRLAPGPLGGPALVAGGDRVFPLTGVCGIASDATAVSVNITVAEATVVGHLRLHAGGTGVPLVSTINYTVGLTRANNAVVPLSPTGELAAFVGSVPGTVHFILDVNGYFAPPGSITKTPGSSGDGQSGARGTPLANPLSVTVANGNGIPASGVTVGWAMETGGGSVGGPTSITNGAGIATQTATLGATGGANTYTARVAGLTGSPVTFTATGLLLPGEFCTVAQQCESGSCVDNVCCDTDCAGVCAACDLPGAVGSCTPVPDGTDPDQECDGVSCVGYYLGWFGDTCRRKADVSAAQATCGGAGVCRTAAQECTSTTQQGPVTTTCDAVCQDPDLSTCTGTIAGACRNVNPGSQTCGSGVCQVTTPQCINGAPYECVPNSAAASPEICDGLDNNCDGTVDNNPAFADPWEPNNYCANYTTLPQIGSNQTLTQTHLTLYPAGDIDYFRISAVEDDGTCSCCDAFCTDEDYRLTVTLTVPAGAGSYQFCTATACNQVAANCISVSQGSPQTWTYNLDGACLINDSYEVFVRVSPWGSPGSSCQPYTLSYSFVPGCFGANAAVQASVAPAAR